MKLNYSMKIEIFL